MSPWVSSKEIETSNGKFDQKNVGMIFKEGEGETAQDYSIIYNYLIYAGSVSVKVWKIVYHSIWMKNKIKPDTDTNTQSQGTKPGTFTGKIWCKFEIVKIWIKIVVNIQISLYNCKLCCKFPRFLAQM